MKISRPSRTSRTSRTTAALLALLVLLSACDLNPPSTPAITPTATPPPGGAELVAATFLSAWEQQDHGGMYSLLSPRSQALVSQANFTARYTQFNETGLITTVRPAIKTALQQGDRAQVSYDVSYESRLVGPFTATGVLMPLVYSEERWSIVWSDGLILPELGGGNVLYLQPRRPGRGNIYARDGSALAADGTVTTIGVIPGAITDEAAVVALLAPLFGLEPDALRERWAGAQADWYVPLGDVAQEVAQQYYDQLTQLAGVELKSKSTRFYRDGGLAPHVVGYTGAVPAEQLAEYRARGYSGDERVGLSGLEQWGEEILAGAFGGQLTVVSPQGDFVARLAEQPAQPARSLYTTLDRTLQQAAQEALAGPIEGRPVRGAVVALDPQTGAVLALASAPAFDPNWFDPSSPYANQLSALLSDPGRPLLNRTTQGVYPPGSVFKIVTMAAALESGQYTPDSLYTCTGVWTGLGPEWIKTDWLAGGHGTITLKQGLIGSCDPYFYELGLRLGEFDVTLMPSYARWFGLGTITGLEGLVEEPGLIPDPLWKEQNVGEGWFPGDSVNMAIGQGFVLATPLQIAQMLAAVANGGTLYRPYVIDYVAAQGGAPEQQTRPYAAAQVPVSPENLAAIREALRGVTSVQGGTARHRFEGFAIPVAGKTGTAQNAGEEPHAWFAGYTLAEDPAHPDIALVVLVENSGEGSAVAAPLFRRIVERYFERAVTPLPWETPSP
jgi:penicillin-binding protein 2